MDDKEFIAKMINLHGRTIVPYIKKFFSDLYDGTISLSTEAGRKRLVAKSEPAKKETEKKSEEKQVKNVSEKKKQKKKRKKNH